MWYQRIIRSMSRSCWHCRANGAASDVGRKIMSECQNIIAQHWDWDAGTCRPGSARPPSAECCRTGPHSSAACDGVLSCFMQQHCSIRAASGHHHSYPNQPRILSSHTHQTMTDTQCDGWGLIIPLQRKSQSPQAADRCHKSLHMRVPVIIRAAVTWLLCCQYIATLWP